MRSSTVRLLATARPLLLQSKNPRCAFLVRSYSTHNQMDFGQRSKLLDSLESRRPDEPKHENVGPFQLGLSPSSLRRGEKVKKWSELSTSGKVLRTTARTSNLGVILLGAGLSALLLYSLTSELFSKNSPTVLYGEACERLKSSSKIAKYLNGPLTFHNNPPSAARPRHRNRHVPSRVMVDAYGQEHMIMTFYVQGRPEGEAAPSDESYFEAIKEWTRGATDALSDLSFDGTVEWVEEKATAVKEKTVSVVKYLSGKPMPPPTLPTMPEEPAENVRSVESSAWGFAGIFSSLRTSSRNNTESPPPGSRFSEGEVHADFVKDKDGYFQVRYLLVDIPNTKDRRSVRIFVERAPGVRENEPVMRWS